MIRIEPPDFKGLTCNSCSSDNDVKLIEIRYDKTNNGMQVALCRECREVLLEELQNS